MSPGIGTPMGWRVRELPSHVLAHEDLEHVARERRAAVAAGHADPAAAVGPAREAVPLADRHQLVEQALARPRAELVEDARQDVAVVRRVAAAVADAKARERLLRAAAEERHRRGDGHAPVLRVVVLAGDRRERAHQRGDGRYLRKPPSKIRTHGGPAAPWPWTPAQNHALDLVEQRRVVVGVVEADVVVEVLLLALDHRLEAVPRDGRVRAVHGRPDLLVDDVRRDAQQGLRRDREVELEDARLLAVRGLALAPLRGRAVLRLEPLRERAARLQLAPLAERLLPGRGACAPRARGAARARRRLRSPSRAARSSSRRRRASASDASSSSLRRRLTAAVAASASSGRRFGVWRRGSSSVVRSMGAASRSSSGARRQVRCLYDWRIGGTTKSAPAVGAGAGGARSMGGRDCSWRRRRPAPAAEEGQEVLVVVLVARRPPGRLVVARRAALDAIRKVRLLLDETHRVAEPQLDARAARRRLAVDRDEVVAAERHDVGAAGLYDQPACRREMNA